MAVITNAVATIGQARLNGSTVSVNVSVQTDVGHSLSTDVSFAITATSAQMLAAAKTAVVAAYLNAFGDTFSGSVNTLIFGQPLA